MTDVALAVLASVGSLSMLEVWFLLGVTVLALASEAYANHFASNDEDELSSPIERKQRRYAAGEIDDERFEARAEMLVDEDSRAVYDRVRSVDWAGHDVALRVAREFRSIDEFEAADREDLEAVHSVGESIAEVLQRGSWYPSPEAGIPTTAATISGIHPRQQSSC